jgi:hypothetical protein
MSKPIDAAEGGVRCRETVAVHVTDMLSVAKHNTKESCWVILYGNVYDVSHRRYSLWPADSAL